jgi:hypothetical protein
MMRYSFFTSSDNQIKGAEAAAGLSSGEALGVG